MRRAALANWSRLPNHNPPRFYTAWTQSGHQEQCCRSGQAPPCRGLFSQTGQVRRMDVGEWLQKLGLQEYEAAFRDNRIDGEILPKLTAEDLKDLGISLVGDRRRLLDAIAALGVAAAAPNLSAVPATGQMSQTNPANVASSTAGERRQLTVMFCDLAGSTALSARLDPEDMRDVIRAYQEVCIAIVASHDGFVAKFMGDGLLAYFGYPRAHEDEAERAVRTGLEIVSAVVSPTRNGAGSLQTKSSTARTPPSARHPATVQPPASARHRRACRQSSGRSP
jgi:hypothetical protein